MSENKEFWQIVAGISDPVWPEYGTDDHESADLASLRLLTESQHFLNHMDERGNVPDDIFAAVLQNRQAAVPEISMPYAVWTTEHDVTQEVDETGRRQQVIWWLGRTATATQVAESGYKYHFSPAAFRRTDIEVAEAYYDQEALRPGMAQLFVSPRMSRKDASVAVAKAEHLYLDDAIRVSTAITNEAGQVVKRRMQSILVRDIPLDAWVAMCKDPGNIFGKALPVRDEQSAISIMELFRHMDLPENRLPEGPVTLVEAVLPYIKDTDAKQRVEEQIKRFRGDQEFYKTEAERAGQEWAEFDLELARSIKFGRATDTLRYFIVQNQHAWDEKSLQVILRHDRGNTGYVVTSELAARLARGKQKLLGDRLSVVANNDRAIEEVSSESRRAIIANHQALAQARAEGMDIGYIRYLESRQYQLLHREVIRSGGGCPGEVEDAFNRNGNSPDGVGELESPFDTNVEGRMSWKWKRGVCRVQICPSPRPTEVGPCDVCKRCQAEFDAGRDPTRRTPVRAKRVGKTALQRPKKQKMFLVA